MLRRAQASLMRKRQRHRETEKVMSPPLIAHRLQVPVSRGDSAITLPAARGAALKDRYGEPERGE
jgi:hypothetical protein